MNTYLIAFTLVEVEGRNLDRFPIAIQERVDPYTKQLSPSTWIVRTNVEPEGILSLLRDDLYQGDKLTVLQLPPGLKYACEGLAEHEIRYLIIQQ